MIVFYVIFIQIVTFFLDKNSLEFKVIIIGV